MNMRPTVFIVDDDAVVRDSVRFLLESEHLHTEGFDSAEAFLQTYSPYRVGCLLLDLRMQGMTGLQLLEQYHDAPFKLPIIVMTGHGNVAVAVEAMKQGAFDFIQKPYKDQQLLDLVHTALEKDQALYQQRLRYYSVKARLDNLTKRENEVLGFILKQAKNKDIAEALGISVKTVEYHRARVMDKMHAATLVDLTGMLGELDIPLV